MYNYLSKQGPLPPEKVQKIFAQLVGAVSYVHSQSCVHRDLKLENILLDKNENVKLCDFGFTREYEGKTNHLQTFCGTVCYSAPEMLKGEKYAGEKVDVWSLGIILYALLAGELPFDEEDDLATKHKIITTEPKYPDALAPEAKQLLSKLLSKRPLIRPSLADILVDPFLAPHAVTQQAILVVTRPAPFTTNLEKDTLQRLRSAGIDIDKVIENVLAQRCDALAGWWALLIEKEERKEQRRERKRREKELEIRSLRRISASSGRRASTLHDVDEEAGEPSLPRGRRERRSFPTPTQLVVPELPRLPERVSMDSPQSATPPPPIEKDSVRSVSSSRQRPPLPPKERERRRSRASTLHLVAANPELLAPPGGVSKRRGNKRRPNVIMNQLASIKHWFVESAKRAKSPGIIKSETPSAKTPQSKSPAELHRAPVPNEPKDSPETPVEKSSPNLAAVAPPRSRYANHRASLSPAPLTPHSSSFRRSSGGLRGRKSTSSSVSSIRSIHHVHTNSKASSTSSTSNSGVSAALAAKPGPAARSPHGSIKVLPATPTAGTFASNVRLGRDAPSPISTAAGASSDRAFGGAMPSPGLVFAKRKKTPFRGPTLHINPSLVGPGSRSRDASAGSRSASQPRRRSGHVIEEEDEDEVEEVDVFSPVAPGEVVNVEEKGAGGASGLGRADSLHRNW